MIRGQLDFEGASTEISVHKASIMSLACTNRHAHNIAADPLPYYMVATLIKTSWLKHTATFLGQWDFEIW